MQHLLSKAVSPVPLSLSQCLSRWNIIAEQLAESPRKRIMQIMEWTWK